VSVYQLKARFQDLLRPLTRSMAGAGVTANQVTVAAAVVSIALGAWLVARPQAALFMLVPVWFLVRMALNAIDGMLAREFGQQSKLGAYLNELSDVVSDAALYVPFAFLQGSTAWLVGALILLAAISEMAGALGVMVGAGRRYDGPMGKSDRAVVFSVVGLLVGMSMPLAPLLDWVWAATCLLLLLTIINRVRGGLHANA
jgi:CDP-diacylglycerol--glycerol-3-phosphate 3-phosphatidyltransferase